MTADEIVADLEDRLTRAWQALDTMAGDRSYTTSQRDRLKAKAEGIATALNYLRPYKGVRTR